MNLGASAWEAHRGLLPTQLQPTKIVVGPTPCPFIRYINEDLCGSVFRSPLLIMLWSHLLPFSMIILSLLRLRALIVKTLTSPLFSPQPAPLPVPLYSIMAIQEDTSRRGGLDPPPKPSSKLSVDYHPYARSGYTGLLTPPLPSPCPSSHSEELSHGTTPPRETDATQAVRLPPISELLKFVPSPAIQLPAPPRQSNWSPTNGAPTPDHTPRSSPTCLHGLQTFANPSGQSLPLPPIIQSESQYPSPPTSHWTHLPPPTTADPGLSLKRRRDHHREDHHLSRPLKIRREDYQEDHPTNYWMHLPPRTTTDPSLSLKRRRDELQDDHRPSRPLERRQAAYREDHRRNSTPYLWAQAQDSPSSAPYFGALATHPPARPDDNAPSYLRRQSLPTFSTHASPSEPPTPYSERSIAPLPKKKKKENTPYTQEQEFFIRYFVVDLGYSWEVVQEHYMHWFPSIHRTVGALTCEYYRTNKQIPVIENGGLLVLGADGPRKPHEELSKRKYRGFKYVCKEQQCRKDRIHTLLEIFPEEYEDEGNGWILAEHRGKGRDAGKSCGE